jgi:hypothetical protein
MVHSAMHLPKPSRWPPCGEKHAVAVLASISDAAWLPRVQMFEGVRMVYDKNPSPMIVPLLTFYPPVTHYAAVTTPTTSYSAIIRFAICLSFGPAWVL